METLIKLLTVLGLGTIGLWIAISAGFALKLDPLATFVTASIGAVLGVLVVLMLAARIRGWLVRQHYCEFKNKHRGRICSIWDRYGVAGLGLLAPLIASAPLGTAIGIALGSPGRRLLFWMSLGIVIWSAVSTLAIALGVVSIKSLWD